jgi:branched-chain amino acid transport system substrate-binding protein
MINHKRLMFHAAACLLLACLAGPVRATDEPVTIGLIIPLSPPGDPASGQLIRRGAEFGVEYVNTVMGGVLGGRKVQLAVQDSQGKPEMGVAAYRRLVTEDHAVAVTGFFHSSVNIAANEVANELGVPTIGTQTGAADVTAKHYEIAFRTHVVDPLRASAWLEWMKKQGYKRVSILAETTDYGIGLATETEEQNKAKNDGFEIQSIAFDHATTDLTPLLLQVKAFKPDVILNIGVGQPLDLMVEQAATLGLLPQTPMLVSYDSPVRPQWWQLHPKNGEVYFIAYYSPKQKLSELGNWLAKAYEEKYKEAPIYAALNGFGDVAIIAQAVEQAKSTDPKAIIKALETGSFKSWATTDVTFPRADGVFWHNWAPPIIILHYTKSDQDWRDAELSYP